MLKCYDLTCLYAILNKLPQYLHWGSLLRNYKKELNMRKINLKNFMFSISRTQECYNCGSPFDDTTMMGWYWCSDECKRAYEANK